MVVCFIEQLKVLDRVLDVGGGHEREDPDVNSETGILLSTTQCFLHKAVRNNYCTVIVSLFELVIYG